MVMIEKKRHECAPERKFVHGNHHIGRHLHLTASLHLKHRVHMEAAMTSMKADAPMFPHKIFITNEDLLQELFTLQKSPVFRDPPMSPSCESMYNSETISRKCELVLFSRKEDSSLQLVGPSSNSEIVLLTNDQRRNYANQGSKRGSLEKKIRRKRVKVWATISNNATASMGLSARGSCSLQSPRALSSAKCNSSLPSAKGLHLLDIDALSDNECRFPWNSARNYSKAIQVSPTQDSKHIELNNIEKSPPCSKPAISLPETADIPNTSCRKEASDAPSTSLSMKYAPKMLCDIIGQHLVTQALINALSKGKVAPMYIFYGPPGTGKTMCARLFSMALNCLSRGNRPCGTCSLCSAQIVGKLSPIKEIQAGKAYTVKEIASLIKEISWSSSFLYKVCIVDECQDLSAKVWNSLLKGTKAASKRTVFIFNTLSVEHIPHAIVSQCQKFHFSKIKESDIIYKLQMIVSQEGLEADTEAIRLIASACNGSLYDAELMLDHFSFLGKRVKVPVVQDLVGLISDSALLELLDFALSENLVHTVQSLRAFHESGVEPLHLIAQLASLITRILAGGYRVPERKLRTRFFQSEELTKDNMQRLRQALNGLSEAEKQLRNSSGGMTWLVAALLKFAPDQSYILSNHPAASLSHSPLERTDNISGVLGGLEDPGGTEKQSAIPFLSRLIVSVNKGPAKLSKTLTHNSGFQHSGPPSSPGSSRRLKCPRSIPLYEAENASTHDNHRTRSIERDDLEHLWQRVLDAINSNNLKCFLRTEGKLVSISFHKDFKEALLEFHCLEHLSRVQRSKASILHAFQATLGRRVKVKVCLVSHATEHLTKQKNSQHEAENLDAVQLATTAICGTERSDTQLKSCKEGTEQNNKETELRDLYEPHIVYDTTPKLENSSKKFNHDERLQIVSAENIEVCGLPNAIKCTPHNAYLRVWSQGSRSSLDDGLSVGYALNRAEESLDGYSLDYRTNTASRRDFTHHMYSNDSHSQKSALAAAKLQEENLRMEPASRVTACWEATNKACGLVECFQSSSKNSKFFLGLFPCASASRSQGPS